MTTDYTTDANNGRELRPIGWTGPTGARTSAHLHITVPMDNHTPTRDYAYRSAERITWPESNDGFTGVEISIPGGVDVFPEYRRALWLLDDGETITPYYTATWHPEHRNIGLKRMTPEAGKPGAGFGPRRTYHVMVVRTDTGTGPLGSHDYRTPCADCTPGRMCTEHAIAHNTGPTGVVFFPADLSG